MPLPRLNLAATRRPAAARRALALRLTLAMALAAAALLPLAALVQTPRPVAAQTAPQGSLWVSWKDLGQVCVNPSAASTSSCVTGINMFGVETKAMATDGVNVYFAGKNGGVSCPIASLGGSCTHIMAGGWGGEVKSLAAEGGQIWIGQDDGKIYRCPANLPYANQSTMPGGCVLLDNAGNRDVDSLLLANGKLYAGLSKYGIELKKQGILWSCDPQAVNACKDLDYYGGTTANSLAFDGTYLWAGLDSGLLWRCDPNVPNQCTDWVTMKNQSVKSISYDGQGTLYVADGGDNGAIRKCSIAIKDSCSDVQKNAANAFSVAAGAGGAFWAKSPGGVSDYAAGISATSWPGEVYYNTTKLFESSSKGNPLLLYIPAGEPAGVGSAKITVAAAKNVARKLAKGCRNGKNPTVTVEVQWNNVNLNYTQYRTTTFKACDLTKHGVMNWTIGMHNTGQYRVTASVGKYSGTAWYTIKSKQKTPVDVVIRRN